MILDAIRRLAAPVSHRLRLFARPELEWLGDRTVPAVVAPYPADVADAAWAVYVADAPAAAAAAPAFAPADDAGGLWWAVDVRETPANPAAALAGAAFALAGVWHAPPPRQPGPGRA